MLERSTESPYCCNAAVGLFIQQVSTGGCHIGILFKDESRPVSLLHMAWHYKLLNETPPSEGSWIPIKYLAANPQLAFYVVEECVAICQARNSQIPYSLFYDGTPCFNGQGEYVGSPGLSCATFVLGVFQAVFLPLADLKTWPTRQTTDELPDIHLRWLMKELKAGNPDVTKEHVDRCVADIGKGPRYYPTEVASCGYLYSGVEVQFLDARAQADLLEADLNRFRRGSSDRAEQAAGG